ncbi:MAG: carboxy-S-adenosyl-L-methionine synthase CmoA [Gammaproteobacteria bacterium]|nr:carboxy-S-adenosyl-L-methionine synthase CmoA [Gammaproteobacteria bacterium]
MSERSIDDLYRDPEQLPAEDFVFDRQVARVFPDMIRRSVPGYATVVNMTGVLAGVWVQNGSNCYDLGCSLGASALSMAAAIDVPSVRILAIDNSAEMIERARRIPRDDDRIAIEWCCADIMEVGIVNASMVVLNYTLQFIPLHLRLELLRRIRAGMRPGAILVLSEKVRFPDATEERLQNEMHHAFKRANGYNELEISRKRSALERVLLPESIAQHRERLASAGFSRCDLWFRCFNFVSMVARV